MFEGKLTIEWGGIPVSCGGLQGYRAMVVSESGGEGGGVFLWAVEPQCVHAAPVLRACHLGKDNKQECAELCIASSWDQNGHIDFQFSLII